MSKYEVEVHNNFDSHDHSEWDDFVNESPQGNIFCRSWWLEAVCPKGFEILVLRNGGRIVAGMPLVRSRKLGREAIHMPKLTQILGVLLAPPTGQKYEKRLSSEMDVLRELVQAIPPVDYFSMNFHHSFTNWLPFYWAGYKQTTQYTYVIPDLADLDKVFSEFSYSKKKNIKKAERLVSVREDLSASDFYANHVYTLRKQGGQISYSFDHFKRIYDAAHREKCGKSWYAIDSKKNIHAVIFVVFDNKSAYYLISTIDPDFRNSGAATLLLRDAITYVSQHTNRFDFEGSMIPGVENSFRKFGAIQTPYFSITKANLLGKTWRMLRPYVGRFARAFRSRRW